MHIKSDRSLFFRRFIFTLCFSNLLFSFNTLFPEDYRYFYGDLNAHDFNFQLYEKNASGGKSNDEPPPMANLEGEPSSSVHGCVNVITGQYCEFQTDLILPHGTDPIRLERSFAGGTAQNSPLGSGWRMNHASALIFKHININQHSDQTIFCGLFGDDHGATFLFEHHSSKYELNKNFHSKGLTNTSQYYISGQTNVHNLKCLALDGKILIRTGANRKREYELFSHKKSKFYLLNKEIKPNGNQYAYNYEYYDHGEKLSKIEMFNQHNKSSGYLIIGKHGSKLQKKEKPFKITANDGRWVSYNIFKSHAKRFLLGSVERSDGPREAYSYYNFFKPNNELFNLISEKRLPEQRWLQVDYYTNGQNPVMHENVHFQDRWDPRIYRVKRLLAPAGPDAKCIPIYEFIYDLFIVTDKKIPQLRIVEHGTCSVYNALGYRVKYGFNKDHRLTTIDKYQANGQHYTHECLHWGNNQSKDAARLITRGLHDGSSYVFARNYQYDEAGNILVDSLYGNLTGNNDHSFSIQPNGDIHENGCDCYRKYQTYSDDDFNLLLKEKDDFKTTVYEYVSNSNRLAAKYQGHESKWLRRTFYFYNEDAAVVKEISDDGSQRDINDLSDVTERKIIDYTQSTIYPVAYPLIIEEKCLDLQSGQEQLIHKVVNTYTTQAKVSKQDHYDSHGNYVYSLFWEYDNMANIIKEVNAIGQITTRRYDANGNCIFVQEGGKTSYKNFTYDYMNRLIKEEEKHPDGIIQMITHRYDIAGNKTATVDENGNETLFKYDAFGRVIETIYPPVLNKDKVLCHPIIKKEYNSLSKVTKEINACGIETVMNYNIRGQLAEIIYPDGTSEKNTYYLNGTLKESKAKNGTITKYTYDCFERPTQTEILDETGELLSTSSMSYNGLHLISETDPAGTVTFYAYYPDGKIKSKKKGDYFITFFYDNLERQNKTIEHYGPNPEDIIVNTKEYDLLNRITSETIVDANNILISKMDYIYDSAGNVHQIVNFTLSGANITKNIYNSHGVLECVVDGEGNKTITHCKYDYRNDLGQIVGYQEITDPQGNTTITISDVLGRMATKLRKNAYGKIIQKQDFFYDLKGNLCEIIDTVISLEEVDQEIVSIMQYDTCDRLVGCYEAYGTPEQRQTKITYNLFGQKENLIKNDGVILSHAYDALGRLKSLKSSDGYIDYSYEYDSNSNPTKIEDHFHATTTIRKYDQNGFMIYEELGNHLALEYSYDYIGRTQQIILPDKTKIAYEYHVNQLKTVNRLDSVNLVNYTHQYETYDYSGNLIKSILANNAGTLNYTYDILGRLKSIVANDCWKEEIKTYDSVGNILETSLHDSLGELSSAYSYDDLYQIISETGSVSCSYSYDSHYNRRLKNGMFHHLNSLHQLIDDGTSVFTYDRNGNLQKKKSKEDASEFIYDALDRLVAFVKDEQKVTYYYDENNRRLSKTFYSLENGLWNELQTVRYLYQGQNEIGSVDKEGRINELRILGIGKGAEVGAAVALEINQKMFIPIHDHIGNVACLLDSITGTIAETYRYSSFGEELFDPMKTINPWRFASKRLDSESGLIYFGRRYYDPAIGRWTTLDPIGREGGPNLYAYVLNSPMTHFDLYGLYGMSDFYSALDSLWESFSNIFSFVAQVPGHIISFVGRDILPIPYVNHLVEFGGWCLRGQNPAAYDWSQHRSQLLVHQGTNNKNPHHIFASTNGICTSKSDHLQRLGEISESYGGVTVYGLHTSYNGVILDILEAGCQKLGIPTNGQLVANRELSKILNQQGENRGKTTIFMDAHSRGTETVYHFDRALREKMELTAFAPAKIAEKGHFNSANYYISPLDGVPLLSPVGYYKGVKNGNVHFLPTTGNPFLDHTYHNKHFQKERAKNGKLYQQEYGKAA